jgi:ABC-2 type transport system ATP-binding protein
MKILELLNLNKKIGEKTILNNISFAIEKGKVLAYLGHNGAGKTTTMRIVLGILDRTDGIIQYNGKEIDYNSKDFDEIRKRFGVMLDTPAFYNEMTAYENLKIFDSLYGLEKSLFDERLNYLSEYLEIKDFLNSKVKTFSKGMRQKISFIRAVIHYPEIVFMDEPMSGVDPVMRVKMRDLIEKLRDENKISFFITSHDLAEMDKISDYVMILEKGNILLYGEMNKIKEGKIIYKLTLNKNPDNSISNQLKDLFKTNEIELKDNIIMAKTDFKLEADKIFEFFKNLGYSITDMNKETYNLEKIYLETITRNEK